MISATFPCSVFSAFVGLEGPGLNLLYIAGMGGFCDAGGYWTCVVRHLALFQACIAGRGARNRRIGPTRVRGVPMVTNCVVV
jgi:hypothetical protein